MQFKHTSISILKIKKKELSYRYVCKFGNKLIVNLKKKNFKVMHFNDL